MGLETPRSVCLECTRDRCIYDSDAQSKPRREYVVARIWYWKTKDKVSISYVSEYPNRYAVASQDINKALRLTRDEAERVADECKRITRRQCQFIVRKRSEEIERINNSE